MRRYLPDTNERGRLRAALMRSLVVAMAVLALAASSVFVMPRVSADDGSTESSAEALKSRDVYISHTFTHCQGQSATEQSISRRVNTDYTYFKLVVYACDTDNKISVYGDGASNSITDFSSTDTDVLEIDSDGNITIKDTGTCWIEATVSEADGYAASDLYIEVYITRHTGKSDSGNVHYAGKNAVTSSLDLDTSEGTQQLIVPVNSGVEASWTSSDPDVLYVEDDGSITPISAGTAQLIIYYDDGGGKYIEYTESLDVTVTGDDIRSGQQITGNTGPFEVDVKDSLQLELHAETALTYTVIADATDCATVDSSGKVTFLEAGTARILVKAAADRYYKAAETTVKITIRDYDAEEAAAQKALEEEEAAKKAAEEEAAKKAAEEEAAKKAAEEAAAKQAAAEAAKKQAAAELAAAKALKKPSFKVKKLKGRKNKLIWGKVANADGYQIYIKYPGKKKYVKAVTKNATVKAIVHKGLSKNRKYSYKVRAFKVVNGKYYYGSFSKVRKVKVK